MTGPRLLGFDLRLLTGRDVDQEIYAPGNVPSASRSTAGWVDQNLVPSGRSARYSVPGVISPPFSMTANGDSLCGIGVPSGRETFSMPRTPGRPLAQGRVLRA